MKNHREEYTFIDKWYSDVAAYGFVQVPKLLIYCQGQLGISDGELVTLVQLISHWYREETEVFPSIGRLANYSDKCYSSIQTRLMRLEQKGFIKRDPREGSSNVYDLTRCRDKLSSLTDDLSMTELLEVPSSFPNGVPLQKTSNIIEEVLKRKRKYTFHLNPTSDELDDAGSIL